MYKMQSVLMIVVPAGSSRLLMFAICAMSPIPSPFYDCVDSLFAQQESEPKCLSGTIEKDEDAIVGFHMTGNERGFGNALQLGFSQSHSTSRRLFPSNFPKQVKLVGSQGLLH